MQQHAEEAERRKEGAKEEKAAFERAAMDGNSAGFAGRDGIGKFDKQDDRARGDVVECWGPEGWRTRARPKTGSTSRPSGEGRTDRIRERRHD